jgi:trafficking protein particle complex subunit 9
MLTNLIPALTNSIMVLYARTSLITSGEVVPQVVFSEFGIRMARFMGSIHMAGGTLTDQCISYSVLGTPLASTSEGSKQRQFPSTRDISALLTRVLPPPSDQSGVSATERITILAGIVSVYSLLGMHRKKALMLKELLETLTPMLQQIRVLGAAEAGFHPSSGLTNVMMINGFSTNEEGRDINELLNAVCQVYGVPEFNWIQSIGMEALNTEDSEDISKASPLPEHLVGNFVLQAFGSLNIKLEILRTCIRVCEALSDYHGILHYSSALLRAAGPGIAQSSDSGDALVELSSEEQLQLSSNILKTVADAKLAGYEHVDAEYWDEFLVRGAYVLDPPPSHVLSPHRKAEIPIAHAAKTSPFIHNPFAVTKQPEVWHNLLAAGEDREFVVSLQNPYEFEVFIEYIKLSAEDGDLNISSQDLTLKPLRTQSFSLIGSVLRNAAISINGCIVKIKGCRERLFPIFSKPWVPSTDIKVKTMGLHKSKGHNNRVSDSSKLSQMSDKSSFIYPIPDPLDITVIPPQPVLIITNTSVSHNALMLLEGEQTSFSVTIHNTSDTVPADFLHISFFDSATAAMHDAISQKGLAAGDLYEIEYQLLKLPAVSLKPNQPTSIQPRSTETFHFQLLAKPGLTSVNVQFDYCNTSPSDIEGKDNIFTRRVILPISVTVNASIQVQRLEVMPLSPDFEWPPKQQSDSAPVGRRKSRFDSVFGPLDAGPKEQEFCILMFDIRNSWPAPLHCQLKASFDQDTKISKKALEHSQTSEIINPGQIVRQILIVPRMYIEDPHAPIRPLSAARQRQFVVSGDRISPETERSLREMFWFREKLLGYLQGSWTLQSQSGERTGAIDLRTVRFNIRMVDVLKLPDISVSYSVLGKSVSKHGKTKFEIQVDDFASLRTSLYNRSNKTISPLLRLRPSLAEQPRELALDLGKRFAWSGVLQQTLPKLGPRKTFSVDLPICALCAGDFEVGATVEEVKSATGYSNPNGKESALDDLVADMGRRTWIAEECCKIVAVDPDHDDDE